MERIIEYDRMSSSVGEKGRGSKKETKGKIEKERRPGKKDRMETNNTVASHRCWRTV